MLLFLFGRSPQPSTGGLQAGLPSKQPLTVDAAHLSVMLSVAGWHVAVTVDSLPGFPAREVKVWPLQQAVPGDLCSTGSLLHLPHNLLHQA